MWYICELTWYVMWYLWVDMVCDVIYVSWRGMWCDISVSWRGMWCDISVSWHGMWCDICELTWYVMWYLWVDMVCDVIYVSWRGMWCDVCELTWYVMWYLWVDMVCDVISVSWHGMWCDICELTWYVMWCMWVDIVCDVISVSCINIQWKLFQGNTEFDLSRLFGWQSTNSLATEGRLIVTRISLACLGHSGWTHKTTVFFLKICVWTINYNWPKMCA